MDGLVSRLSKMAFGTGLIKERRAISCYNKFVSNVKHVSMKSVYSRSVDVLLSRRTKSVQSRFTCVVSVATHSGTIL